jgi:hypothetical protein
MEIVGRCLSVDQFREYLAGLPGLARTYNTVYVHHTTHDSHAPWLGEKSIQGLKAYYESLGWSSGPHLFIAPEGIWLFTPLTQDGTGVTGHNWHSRHVEIVGNFMDHLPEGAVLSNALAAIGELLRVAQLSTGTGLRFHGMDEPTECPGKALKSSWVWFTGLITRYINNEHRPLPRDETTTNVTELVRKAVWWSEELVRQMKDASEGGDISYADTIALDMVAMMKRLQALLKETS